MLDKTIIVFYINVGNSSHEEVNASVGKIREMIKPNKEDEELTECVVRNCSVEKNKGYGIQFWLGNLTGKSEAVSVRIENCVVRDNPRGALMVGGGEVGGKIEIKGSKMTGKTELGNKSGKLVVDIKT